MSRYILQNLSNEIRDSRYFAILADEAADIANKENLSIVIRFVDASNTIREEFAGFYQCNEGTTGEAIKNVILKVIADMGLCMDDCRGQCYDGAGNMAGEYNGASALIQQQFEKAIYVHCLSHRLNLCVADTCSITLVKNMMGMVKKLSDFFHNSPKRHGYLMKKIKDMMPASTHNTLIDVCRTRWIARLDGMDRMIEFIKPVMSTLEDISMNQDAFGNLQWNYSSRNDAQVLINAVNFPFIVALVIVGYILDLTRPLTQKLQAVQMDLMGAKSEIDDLKSALAAMQNDIDNQHHDLYTRAVAKAEEIDIEPCMPRINQRQIYRANAPAATPEDYYRVNLTTVFLGHVVQQINTRFHPEQVNSYCKGLYIIPGKVLDNPVTWKAEVKDFCQEYQRDIPNILGLDAELFMWENKWENHFINNTGHIQAPETIKDTLQYVDKQGYPNVYTILQILATLPVTSSTCERSISAMRNLKTYLRNTMSEDRFNGLALMYAHRELELPIDTIIDMFANLHPRRMKMVNILDDNQ